MGGTHFRARSSAKVQTSPIACTDKSCSAQRSTGEGESNTRAFWQKRVRRSVNTCGANTAFFGRYQPEKRGICAAGISLFFEVLRKRCKQIALLFDGRNCESRKRFSI
jgi:hypothetical protein